MVKKIFIENDLTWVGELRHVFGIFMGIRKL